MENDHTGEENSLSNSYSAFSDSEKFEALTDILGTVSLGDRSLVPAVTEMVDVTLRSDFLIHVSEPSQTTLRKFRKPSVG